MKRTLIMLYRARYGEEEEMVKSVAAAVSPARRSRRRSLRKRAAGQRPLALELHAMKGRIVVIAAPRENGGAGASASPARLEGKLDAWLAAEQAASFAGMHYSFYASVEGELPALAEAVHAAMRELGAVPVAPASAASPTASSISPAPAPDGEEQWDHFLPEPFPAGLPVRGVKPDRARAA